MTSANSRNRDCIAILVALVLPTIITYLYFFQAAGTKSSLQVAIFGVLKVLQFGFPIAYVWLLQGGAKGQRGEGAKGIGIFEGLIFGGIIAAAMLALYFGLLRGSPSIEGAIQPIQEKVKGFGIDSVAKYIALGVFYSLCHSLLEEYYWRWFVFGQLRKQVSLTPAIAISSVGFMAHHVLVLGKYFGFPSWQTIFFSLCVAVGGAVWAWLYDRHKSLLGPWLSHLLVDAAIFAIGYNLVRSIL